MTNAVEESPKRIKSELELSLEREGWQRLTNISRELLDRSRLFFDGQYMRYALFTYPEVRVVEEAYESDGVTKIPSYVALYARGEAVPKEEAEREESLFFLMRNR